MELRTITQVKIYKLLLNDMRSSQIEQTQLAAMSYEGQKLMNWIKEQKEATPYTDEGFSKVFKKGSALEWFNEPMYSHQGVFSEWIEQDFFQTYLSTHSTHFIF